MKNYPILFRFMILLGALAGFIFLLHRFEKFENFFNHYYPFIFLGGGWAVILLLFFRTLSSRADRVWQIIADKNKNVVHVISVVCLSGGENTSHDVEKIMHNIIFIDSGKLYRTELGSYDDRKVPRDQIEEVEKLVLFKNFQKSLKKLSKRSGVHLEPVVEKPEISLPFFHKKEELTSKDLNRVKEKNCLYVSSKEDSSIHLSLISTDKKIIWQKKLKGKWYSGVKQPLILDKTVFLVTQKNAFPAEILLLQAIALETGKVLWKVKL